MTADRPAVPQDAPRLRWWHFRHTWTLVGRTPIRPSVNASLHFRCSVCGREKVKLGY